MKLFIYNREKCMLSVAQEGQRSIRMDRNGCIFLSGALVQELGLQAGSMAVLVGDEDDPRQWFLCIVDDEGGFPVRLKKRKRYNSKGMPEEYCQIPLPGLTGNMSERRTEHKWKYEKSALI